MYRFTVRTTGTSSWGGGPRHAEVQALFIEPGSPWEGGYLESLSGTASSETNH